MRNQLYFAPKDSKVSEEEEEAARSAAMRTIVVPGKQDIGNVLLDISYFPFEYVLLC